MKSVLLINYEYPPVGGGASNASFYFAKTMAAMGIRTTVLTSAYQSMRGLSVEDGVYVYRIPAFRKHASKASVLQMLMYFISALLHVPRVVKRSKPDSAIVFFSIPCGPLGLLLRCFYQIPFILLLRGGDVPGFEAKLNQVHRFLRPLRRLIYKKSHAIISNSVGLKEMALKADPGFKIQVINNGVDTDFFCPSQLDEKVNKNFTFLFAGRFCEQKNLKTLIKAFSICLTRNSEIRLILIGDGPLLKTINEQIKNSGIDNYIQLVGWRLKEELRCFYRSSHCFVNPSIVEGMSNAVLEAMASALPVIAGNCTGNNEIILNGKNGFLFNPLDSDELANRMDTLIKNSKIGKQMGENGRKMCNERFSWPKLTSQLIFSFKSEIIE